MGKKIPPPHSIALKAATLPRNSSNCLASAPQLATTKAIVEFRTKSGRFHRVEDLLVIRGISEEKLKKTRPYVTIGPPPPKKPPPVAPNH